MPNPMIAPNKQQLEKYVRRGLTQKEMVEQWERDSGYRVSRSTVAMAMRRFDVQSPRSWSRNLDLVPWKVRPEHKMHYDLRMLRLEGRRRRGESISSSPNGSASDLDKLTSWINHLREANAVIHYVPYTIEGFWWVPREATDDDLIRQPAE